MTDAFVCDRCNEFHKGSGTQTRYGVYLGTSGFNSKYDFEESCELCKDCKEELDKIVSEFMRESEE